MITKLDVDVVHHEPWKSIYFGVKRSQVKARKAQKRCRRGHGALVGAGVILVCLCLLCLRHPIGRPSGWIRFALTTASHLLICGDVLRRGYSGSDATVPGDYAMTS